MVLDICLDVEHVLFIRFSSTSEVSNVRNLSNIKIFRSELFLVCIIKLPKADTGQ